MKKIVILIIGLLWSSIAIGAVSLRMCEADGNTPFDSNTPIMVGTKLTIYVDSNSQAADWGGGLDIVKSVPEPNPPIGKLFGRGWDSGVPDYAASHLASAGDRASVIDWENEHQQSFELSAAGQQKAAGTWFVLDYNAMNIGDCAIELVEYHGPEIFLVTSKIFHQIATRDFNGDGKINFADFAKLASYWQHTDCNALNNCEGTDLNLDGKIDFVDVMYFADYWLGQKSERDGLLADAGSSMTENTALPDMSGSSVSELSAMDSAAQPSSVAISSQSQAVQQQPSTSQSLTPAIYLTCDTNSPDPNQEVTVWVHSDKALFAMGLVAYVVGDANLTTAMGEADCTTYGWDPGWKSGPYIDPNYNLVYLSGVSWYAKASGVVGYFRFIYHGGRVSVSIDAESDAFDGYSQPVLFSVDPLVFGRKP